MKLIKKDEYLDKYCTENTVQKTGTTTLKSPKRKRKKEKNIFK